MKGALSTLVALLAVVLLSRPSPGFGQTFVADLAFCNGTRSLGCFNAVLNEVNTGAYHTVVFQPGTWSNLGPGGGTLFDVGNLLLTSETSAAGLAVNGPDVIFDLTGTTCGFVLNQDNVTFRGFSIRRSAGSCTESGVTVNNAANVTFEYCEFADHVLDDVSDGGGLHLVSAENVTIRHCNFSGSAATRGGALALTTSSNVVVEDCVFSGSRSAESGGTIDVDGGANVSFHRVDVADSQCYDAGGCLAAKDVTNLEIADSSFVDCSVSASVGSGVGGGLYLSLVTGVVDGVSLIDVVADGEGAGMLITDRTDLLIDNLYIEGGFCLGEGGGIRVNGDSTVAVTNATIVASDAGSGGGISIRGAVVVLLNVTIDSCYGNLRGGGIDCGVNCKLNVTDSTLVNNYCPGDGGGISLQTFSDDRVAHLDGVVFVDNFGVVGGGLLAVESHVVARDVKFYGNIADYGGGACFEGVSSDNNIFTVDVDGLEASDNHAIVFGGGVFVAGAYTPYLVTISNAFMSDNTADDAGGSLGVEETISATNFSGVYLQDSRAWEKGGCMFVTKSTGVFMSDTTMVGCDSEGDGGGVDIEQSEVTFSGLTVEGSYAFERGGGISSVESNVTLLNADLFDLSASYGGGIFVAGGRLRFTDPDRTSVVSDCFADTSGGGLYVEVDGFESDLAVEVSGLTITDCSAGTVGGAIVVTGERAAGGNDGDAAQVSLTGFTVVGNTAFLGGGLYAGTSLLLDDSAFQSNTAIGGSGGAAAVVSDGCFGVSSVIRDTTFEQSSASLNGGAVFVDSASLAVVGSVFETSSSSGTAGGAIFATCSPAACLSAVRTACDEATLEVSATRFAGSAVGLPVGSGDGGAIAVEAIFLALATDPPPARNVFVNNMASRGSAVFAALSAPVVSATTGADVLSEAEVLGSGSVIPSGVDALASPTAVPRWRVPPAGGMGEAVLQSGDPLCDRVDGCSLRADDTWGQPSPTPSLAEVGIVRSDNATSAAERALAGLVMGGPQFVVITNGTSERVFEWAITVGDEEALAEAGGAVVVPVGLRFDATNEGTAWTSLANVTVGGCLPGYGTVNATGGACVVCPPGTFSEGATALDPLPACADCPTGRTSDDAGPPSSCSLCAPGWGGMGDGGSSGGDCVACPEGFFSGSASPPTVACLACNDSLTNTGSGNAGCPLAAIPVDSGITTVAIIITAVFGLVGIVVLIASCLTSSSARHGAIGVVLLSLYDVLTDYLFLFTMVDANTDGQFDGLIVASVVSIAVSFAINAIITAFVLVRERRRPDFAKWLRGNVVTVGVVAVLSTSNVSVLSVLSSRLFGSKMFRAPVSSETEDLVSIGGVAAVFFEDIPQLVVSILYVSGDGIPGAIVLLSLFASSVGILSGLVLRVVLCCVIGVEKEGGGGDDDDGEGGRRTEDDDVGTELFNI